MRRPKETIIRSEPYRRLVAALPCIHCQWTAPSQAAHENAGKGQRMKVCDTKCFPLCSVNGRDCHGKFDNYRLVPGGREAHADLGRIYTERTRAMLIASAATSLKTREVLERIGMLEMA